MSSPLARTFGPDFARLPPVLQTLHEGEVARHCRVKVDVIVGRNRVARALARLAGFPPGQTGAGFAFSILPLGTDEIWHRGFGKHVTRSRLTGGTRGLVVERFGPFRLTLRPSVVAEGLTMEVGGQSAFCLSLPRWFLPRTTVREALGPDGAVVFDISASLPLIGPLIAYRGWLRPA